MSRSKLEMYRFNLQMGQSNVAMYQRWDEMYRIVFQM